MTSTRSAGAPGLPNSRRGFLRQLAALPLVGGGISLIGSPTAVAEPITFEMLQTYKTWLHFEHKNLAWELAEHPRMVAWYGGDQSYRFHQIEPLIAHIGAGESARFHQRRGCEPASDRAALVLGAVGCRWWGGDQ